MNSYFMSLTCIMMIESLAAVFITCPTLTWVQLVSQFLPFHPFFWTTLSHSVVCCIIPLRQFSCWVFFFFLSDLFLVFGSILLLIWLIAYVLIPVSNKCLFETGICLSLHVESLPFLFLKCCENSLFYHYSYMLFRWDILRTLMMSERLPWYQTHTLLNTLLKVIHFKHTLISNRHMIEKV